jgi:hypothetical protein
MQSETKTSPSPFLLLLVMPVLVLIAIFSMKQKDDAMIWESKPNSSAVKESGKPTLPIRGKIYTIGRTTGGPINLSDRDAVETTLQYDTSEGKTEMVMAKRMGLVFTGDMALVLDIDTSFSHGTWVEVRIIHGFFAKGKLWIPLNAIQGF